MIDRTQFGGYNDFPPGWREVDSGFFARKMTLREFTHQEHRQMHRQGDPLFEFVNGQLFFFWDGTGVAVSSSSEGEPFNYKDVARFWAFGCDHEYEDLAWDRETMGPRFSCDHASKCKKCGHVLIVDSSD